MPLRKTFHTDRLNVSSKTTYRLIDDGFQRDHCIHLAGFVFEEPDEVDAVLYAKYENYIGRLREVAFPATDLLLR